MIQTYLTYLRGGFAPVGAIRAELLFLDEQTEDYIVRWLLQRWWILLIVAAYVAIGVVFFRFGTSFCGLDEYDEDEPIFWIVLLASLLWPVSLLVWLIRCRIRKESPLPFFTEDEDDGDGDEGETDLTTWSVEELRNLCRENGITGYSRLNKAELIERIERTLGDEDDDEDDNDDDDDDEDEGADRGNRGGAGTAKKSASADFSCPIPRIHFDDIAGLDEAKQAIRERVVLPLRHKEVYEKYGKKVGGGVLLYGLPGTGKTMFAQAVATELKAKFYSVKCSDIMSKWYGESERRIKTLFSDARKNKVAVVFFDEFEAIGRSRTESDTSNVTTVQEILAQMQGVEGSQNILLVLAATNCPWEIDSALLRPGRFHEKIYIPLPDQPARVYMLRKNLGTIGRDPAVSFEETAKRLEGFNGADIAEFCDQVKMCLINKELSGDKSATIAQADIDTALCKVHSSVDSSDIEMMDAYRAENRVPPLA